MWFVKRTKNTTHKTTKKSNAKMEKRKTCKILTCSRTKTDTFNDMLRLVASLKTQQRQKTKSQHGMWICHNVKGLPLKRMLGNGID